MMFQIINFNLDPPVKEEDGGNGSRKTTSLACDFKLYHAIHWHVKRKNAYR